MGVVYTQEDLWMEEEEIAAVTPGERNIETHRAFNEAEKFIAEAENTRDEISEEMEQKLAAMKDAIEKGGDTYEIPKVETDYNSEAIKEATRISKNSKKGVNRNSTNSYRLENRTDLYLPNPVYTCDGYGKVVIAIVVSETGKVVKANYSKKGSSTANQCLIDQALEYAKLSRFDTALSIPEQRGTITYNFPGQD